MAAKTLQEQNAAAADPGSFRGATTVHTEIEALRRLVAGAEELSAEERQAANSEAIALLQALNAANSPRAIPEVKAVGFKRAQARRRLGQSTAATPAADAAGSFAWRAAGA